MQPERSQNEYTPDVVSPPGDTIRDIMKERGLTAAKLAERMDFNHRVFDAVLNGQHPINPEVALKLEAFIGGRAEFWLRREANYRRDRGRRRGGEVAVVADMEAAALEAVAVQMARGPALRR